MITLDRFFTDPILRGPTIGCMLMGFACAFVGVLAFVRKRSLLGETLSHASYPGVIVGILLSVFFQKEEGLSFFILIGGSLSAFLGFWLVDLLERKERITSDGSLCLVLVLFFGVGVLLASIVQSSHPHLYRQIQSYLYGQAATMGDSHIFFYAFFAAFVSLVVTIFYKEILALSFNREYAQAAGILSPWLNFLLFFLIVLAVIIGIRSVGVILMSAMLIAPPLAARQFTDKLSTLFLLSGIFGMGSGFLGNYFSLLFSDLFSQTGAHLSFPTGPMIVVVSAFLAALSLLFAPKKGLIICYCRMALFRIITIQENLLKTSWHLSEKGKNSLSLDQIGENYAFSRITLRVFLAILQIKGWICIKNKKYHLQPLGIKRGGRIIRLHRLWELYLVNSLGVGVDCVHKSAEEMEHILTPELEKQLTILLDNPKEDPHAQPIPDSEGMVV